MNVIIGGDFCPENRVKKLLANGDQVFLDDNKKIWDLADFRILNLEGSINNSNSKLKNRRKILLSYIRNDEN